MVKRQIVRQKLCMETISANIQRLASRDQIGDK
jgi:hypothetical protein